MLRQATKNSLSLTPVLRVLLLSRKNKMARRVPRQISRSADREVKLKLAAIAVQDAKI